MGKTPLILGVKSPNIFSTVEKFVVSEADGSETLVYSMNTFFCIFICGGMYLMVSQKTVNGRPSKSKPERAGNVVKVRKYYYDLCYKTLNKRNVISVQCKVVKRNRMTSFSCGDCKSL